jgi:hypothetical protein
MGLIINEDSIQVNIVPGVTNLPLLETVSVHVAPVKPSGQTQIHWKFTNPPF